MTILRAHVLLTSIAVLFLATGAAPFGALGAEPPDTDKFYLHLHACNVVLQTNQYDTLELTDLLALQKYIPLLRACDAFYKCVYKRDFPKHYATAGATDPVKPGEKRLKSALGQLVF
jgi:hypothetical protein